MALGGRSGPPSGKHGKEKPTNRLALHSCVLIACSARPGRKCGMCIRTGLVLWRSWFLRIGVTFTLSVHRLAQHDGLQGGSRSVDEWKQKHARILSPEPHFYALLSLSVFPSPWLTLWDRISGCTYRSQGESTRTIGWGRSMSHPRFGTVGVPCWDHMGQQDTLQTCPELKGRKGKPAHLMLP
jgi:hypothetical protein